ncbi:unnamed protein product [Caenorhabditis brenneri]
MVLILREGSGELGWEDGGSNENSEREKAQQKEEDQLQLEGDLWHWQLVELEELSESFWEIASLTLAETAKTGLRWMVWSAELECLEIRI